MKKSYLALAVIAVLAVGCAKEYAAENPVVGSSASSEITVSMPAQTRTAFGEESEGIMSVVWSDSDQIKVIDATSEPAKEGIYTLENGKGGGATATFSHSSGDVIENVTDIVYPATAAEDLSIPAAQTYTAGSYDPVAAVLKYHSEEPVAISSEGFQLENTASIIAISLKGNETVASVSAALTPANGGETHVYTLSSEEGVSLSADAIPFYIAVPGSDTEYELDVTVNSSNGSEPLTQETSEPRAFAASSLVRFPALEYSVAAGKTYAIGDYWPDEENAEGIVFYVTDGGLHGKVISPEEIKAVWGPKISEKDNGIEASRKDPEDGQLITKSIIEKYKDTETFATDYPCFEWIYNTMNNGDINGPWYAPSRKELGQWAAAMCGFAWAELEETWVSVEKNENGEVTKTTHGYDADKIQMPGWTDAKAAREEFKTRLDKIKKGTGENLNLSGKYCSTWESTDGNNVFRFNLTNDNSGGQFAVITKLDETNRIRPVRTF